MDSRYPLVIQVQQGAGLHPQVSESQRLIHNSMEAKLMGTTSRNSNEDDSSSGGNQDPIEEDNMPWLDDNENQQKGCVISIII